MTTRHHEIAIVGAGFGGIGAGAKLLEAGFSDFVIFERETSVGGVWRDNTYPGCACDVESHLYSFSFAPNPRWSRAFSPQPEIRAYLEDCADRFGLRPHLRLGQRVTELQWENDAKRWRIETSSGVHFANVVIAATGGLSEPSIPKLPGLASFRGKVMHSARWDHGYPLAGKRVAVVGTGASAIQFVPAIQPEVARLTLFQRTPPWVLPRGDRAVGPVARALYRRLPALQLLVRFLIYALRELLVPLFNAPTLMKLVHRRAKRHLARQIPDPALRAKLTPDYVLGCKRVLLSDDYLPALAKENVEVVTDGIEAVTADAVLTRDGRRHPVDVLLFGTGFEVTDAPISHHVRGKDGRTLAETWGGSPKAHLGTTVTNFPNLFLLQGPNTGLGHTSVITMIESQIDHAISALRFLRHGGFSAVEPRADAQAAFVTEVDEMMQGTVWTSGGCHSWYLDRTGRNSTLWPSFTFTFRHKVERFLSSDYAWIP